MVISFEGLSSWITLLTTNNILILFLFPIVIEYSRSIFKILFLILYNIRNQKHRLKDHPPPGIFKPKITILIQL